MSAIGGPIQSVTIKGRTFVVAEDADASVNYGGDKNEIAMNGDGKSARLLKSKVAWKVGGLKLQIDPDRNDHEFLQDAADENDFWDYSHTEVDGNTYYGQGQFTEDLEKSSKDATLEVTVMGPGRLTKQ